MEDAEEILFKYPFSGNRDGILKAMKEFGEQEYKRGAIWGYVEGFKSAVETLQGCIPSVEERLNEKIEEI